MSHVQDDDIEMLLRQQLDGPVADGGFSQRVMQRLPTRRRRAAWPLWAGVLTGTGACWLSLMFTPLLHAGWRDWLRGDPSVPAICLLLAAAGMAVLACWWAMAEAEDH
jgi:hypothetical protein